MHWLSTLPKTVSQILQNNGFHYLGAEEYFPDMVIHMGWAIDVDFYQERDDDEPDDPKGYLCLIWLETGDAWCQSDVSSFDSRSEAVSYAIALIDEAIRMHSSAPGQLSLFTLAG